jgi:hypothetical protein
MGKSFATVRSREVVPSSYIDYLRGWFRPDQGRQPMISNLSSKAGFVESPANKLCESLSEAHG